MRRAARVRDGDLILLGQADARRIPLPDESVQCCITSPPYWGLRDYGLNGRGIGLEASPQEYVAQIVAVFREVWRVLRSDGTAWLNLGDSYASQGGHRDYGSYDGATGRAFNSGRRASGTGLKPKDLCMIPARVALALQADGWYLRSDIIWAKGVSFCPTYSGSVMPESVRDRPTTSHEHVFLLAKSRTYFYDQEAVKENFADTRMGNPGPATWSYGKGSGRNDHGFSETSEWNVDGSATGRNLRSVWTINPKPSRLAHYAAFPPALVEPMVLAGTSAKGACPKCGKAWERVVERERPPADVYTDSHKPDAIKPVSHPELGKAGMGQKLQNWYNEHPNRTIGWRPGCYCGTEHKIPQEELDADPTLLDDEIEPFEPVPCTILDPFGGTMTVGQVCAKHGRRFVGLDLNLKYVRLGQVRLAHTQMVMSL